MISRFISSRFSGYIAIAGVVAVLGLVSYIYNEGKTACENNVKSEQLDSSVKTSEEARGVKKNEQSLQINDVQRGLCSLGIVRGNRGCQ